MPDPTLENPGGRDLAELIEAAKPLEIRKDGVNSHLVGEDWPDVIRLTPADLKTLPAKLEGETLTVTIEDEETIHQATYRLVGHDGDDGILEFSGESGIGKEAARELAAAAEAEAKAAWDELVAQAKPIDLQDRDGKVHLVGAEWPAVARIARVMLEGNEFATADGESNGDHITLVLANARAVYQIAGEVEGTIYCRLTEDHGQPVPEDLSAAETPAEPQAPEGAESSSPAPDPLSSIPDGKAHAEQVELVDGGPAQAQLIEPHGDKGWQIAVRVIRGGKQYGRILDVTGTLHGFNDPVVVAAKQALVTEVEASLKQGEAALPALEGAEPAPQLTAAALATEKRAGVTQEPPAADPNVKCPECKLYGNRHRPSCSRAA